MSFGQAFGAFGQGMVDGYQLGKSIQDLRKTAPTVQPQTQQPPAQQQVQQPPVQPQQPTATPTTTPQADDGLWSTLRQYLGG